MYKTFSAFLASRLRLGNNSPSTLTGAIIAVAGVAASVTIMLMTIAISDGFNNGIKSKLAGFEPALSVSAPFSYVSGNVEEFITLDPDIKSAISSVIPNSSTTLSLRQPAIIKTPENFEAIIIRGYGSDFNTDFLKSNLIEGRLPHFGNSDADTCIVISSYIAHKLGLKVGQRVNTFFFVKDLVKARRYTISGIYESGFVDFDKTIAYGSLASLQQLNNISENTGTIIEINTPGPLNRAINEQQSNDLQDKISITSLSNSNPDIPVVGSISNNGAVYLNWLDLIETNVVVIFIIMCLVASLTLISSLFIIILDRIPTIGLLRALGATKGQIKSIFLHIAMKLVGLGVVIGNIIALGLGYLQQQYHLVSLDPEMYYLTSVPYEFNWPYIIGINIGTIMLAWTVLILPARLAGNISPARTIRYE